ncbi:MAG: pyridoxal phosphate-dependent decarboxylase family protein [Steroidobacteraceae bacterium]
MTQPREIASPIAALFPAASERERVEDRLTRELIAACERVAAGSVTPTLDLAEFRCELAAFDFHEPRPLDELLSWCIGQLEHGIVHLTHPRYFGLFNPAPTFPARCADRIAGAFNPQLATWTTSPVAVEIERHVVRSVALRLGLPDDAGGHFTSGGSEANFTALLCALARANPRYAIDGARAFDGAPVFYTSRESHLAWLKVAHQAGIGRSAVRLVATDGKGCLNARELADLIATDRASGRTPVMIVATAGTTNAGMIDPLDACADLAQVAGAWYHVDAAWGGALVASDALRNRLAGIERADSITLDAHKWFATTMGAGMFMTRHASLLSTVFRVSTTFMPSELEQIDPYVTTAQWSRRFIGLRLFLSLAAAGWAGYRTHVERAIAIAAELRCELVARGWTVANDSPLAVLCVRPPARFGTPRSIVKRVLDSGRAWVAAAKLEEQDVIRICVTHGEATGVDVRELANVLDRCGPAEA